MNKFDEVIIAKLERDFSLDRRDTAIANATVCYSRLELEKKIEERIAVLQTEIKAHEYYSAKLDETDCCNCIACEKNAKAILELCDLRFFFAGKNGRR